MQLSLYPDFVIYYTYIITIKWDLIVYIIVYLTLETLAMKTIVAMKTIMAGVNQTLMLALSMVVIAALIGAGGLGLTVYVALGRLDIGGAVVGGTGIVILAIILDRITQKIIPQDDIKTR